MSCEDICREILEEMVRQVLARPSQSQSGVWQPDPSLGPGWKSYLVTPARGESRPVPGKVVLVCSGNSLERRMFYAPSGSVFYTRAAALKYLQSEAPTGQLRPPVEMEDTDGSVALSDNKQEDDVISLSDEELGEPPRKRARCERETELPEVSPRQEEVLVCCYSEWPLPTQKVVSEIVKDTGLPAQVVRSWYQHRTRNIIQHILSSDKY